jgi:hypothetical protein
MTSSLEISLNPDVVCSVLDSGGVLLDLETKQYFALNSTGLLLWQFLEDGGSLAALGGGAAAGPRRLSAPHAVDLDAFARSLIAHGLAIAEAPNGGRAEGSPRGVPPPLPDPWVPPTVVPHGRPLSQVILSPFDPTVPIPE